MRVTNLSAVLAVFVAVFSITSKAESVPGAVYVQVLSAEGAPVCDARVLLSPVDASQSLEARRGPDGTYLFSDLPAGRYQLAVGHPDYRTGRKLILNLASGAVLAANLILQTSETGENDPQGSEKAEDSATAVSLKAEVQPAQSSPAASSGSSSGQISESQLAGLPLNGRSYSQLATLQAGVSDSSAGSSSRGVGGGSLTIAGGRSTSNNFLLDGTNIMDTENNVPRSAAGVQLGSDAVLQVQVFSTTYSAEYGRGSGGVLNSISRSGSNELHGTFFEYFRNSKLDTRNFFDGASPPPFKRNQFGATVSGPLRKDRTFFMASFEALRDRLNTTDVAFFPDAAARLGFPDASGIPTVPVDPRVKPYLDLMPMPNDIPIGRGVGRNLHAQFLPTDETFLTARVDQKISDHDGFFARYTFDDATSYSAQDTYLFHTLALGRQQYLTLVGTHIFSPSTLVALRAGYTRPVTNFYTANEIEIPKSLYFISDAPAFGQIQVPGLSNFGPETTIRRLLLLNTFQYAADWISQRGAHGLKAGADIHRDRANVDSDFNKGGLWSFNSLDNFLQAGPVGTNVAGTAPGGDNMHALRQTTIGLYIQDQYRVSANLSVSTGLRYEYASNFTDKLNRMNYLADPIHDTQVKLGPYFKDTSKLNFAPRIGFSWSPQFSRNTTVSGGFGVHYDLVITYMANNRKNSLPFQRVVVNPNAELAQRYFPDAIAAAGDVPGQVQIMDYNGTRTPMVMRYNLSVQHRIGGGWRASVAYVGARGNRLLRRYEMNQFPQPEVRADGSLFFPAQCPASGVLPAGCRVYAGPINPAFGSISTYTMDGQSFYNALQLTASKDVGRGFSIQGSYSLSKSVDDNSVGNSTNFGQYALWRTLDRGLSDFDIRHRIAANYFYSLPRWPSAGGFAGRIASHALSDWRLGGIVSMRTGTSFSPGVNIRYKDYLFAPSRPNLRPGASNNPTSGSTAGCGLQSNGQLIVAAGRKLGTPELYFDPCAFEAPPPGSLGNAGRNTITAPSVFNMDLSVQKEFLIDAKHRLQFRGEIFNFLNHTNFNAPASGAQTVLSGQSATYTSRAGRITQTNTTSRQLQFALRLSF